ncbi:hypothetical protein B0H16DRAFT_1890758 [Mycena metata]|uniref:Uncharacterized protein n=1 Tax=Mycena metata TaxID=1033252 RepID=A0AAD7IDF4_9AGAR|nr:hypothetical protein B0H16DRAFT_1890758 [Mycena metata]
MLLAIILKTLVAALVPLTNLWRESSAQPLAIVTGQWWAENIALHEIAAVKTWLVPAAWHEDWVKNLESRSFNDGPHLEPSLPGYLLFTPPPPLPTCAAPVLPSRSSATPPTSTPFSPPESSLQFQCRTKLMVPFGGNKSLRPHCAVLILPSPTCPVTVRSPEIPSRVRVSSIESQAPSLLAVTTPFQSTFMSSQESSASPLRGSGDTLLLNFALKANGVTFAELPILFRRLEARVWIALFKTVSRPDTTTEPIAQPEVNDTTIHQPLVVQDRPHTLSDLAIGVGLTLPEAFVPSTTTTPGPSALNAPVALELEADAGAAGAEDVAVGGGPNGEVDADKPADAQEGVLAGTDACAEVLPLLDLPGPLDAEVIFAALGWTALGAPAPPASPATVELGGIEEEEEGEGEEEEEGKVVSDEDGKQVFRTSVAALLVEIEEHKDISSPSPLRAPALAPSSSESALWAAPPTPPTPSPYRLASLPAAATSSAPSSPPTPCPQPIKRTTTAARAAESPSPPFAPLPTAMSVSELGPVPTSAAEGSVLRPPRLAASERVASTSATALERPVWGPSSVVMGEAQGAGGVPDRREMLKEELGNKSPGTQAASHRDLAYANPTVSELELSYAVHRERCPPLEHSTRPAGIPLAAESVDEGECL